MKIIYLLKLCIYLSQRVFVEFYGNQRIKSAKISEGKYGENVSRRWPQMECSADFRRMFFRRISQWSAGRIREDLQRKYGENVSRRWPQIEYSADFRRMFFVEFRGGQRVLNQRKSAGKNTTRRFPADGRRWSAAQIFTGCFFVEFRGGHRVLNQRKSAGKNTAIKFIAGNGFCSFKEEYYSNKFL